MFIIHKISEIDAGTTLTQFLISRRFLPLFFYSPYTLTTWLMHQNKSLYLAQLYDEKALILHKEKNNDVRFLFTDPSEALLKEVLNHFNPNYIAFNQVVTPQMHESTDVEDCELSTDLNLVVNQNNKEIWNAYNKCIKRHPELTVCQYKETDKDSVRIFLEEWSHSRSEEKNKYAKIENDNHFLDTYGNNEEIMGIVVKDGQKIVAISFACPSLDQQAIGVINKCLRGYVQLGIFTFVQRAKLMQSRGFTKCYIGSINNDFKKKFIHLGNLQSSFSRKIFNEKDFTSHDFYLSRLF